jgi:hypothetical protein
MSADWTQATRGTRLLWLPIPAYAGLPILLWVMHARIWTFILAISICIALSVLRAKGRSVPWVVRRFKSYARAGVVQARTIWYLRRVRALESFDLVSLKGSGKQ